MSDTSRQSPSGPPEFCPTCGELLGDFAYYEVRPGRSARQLQAFAKLLLPVMGVLVFALLLVGGPFKNFSVVSGYFFVAVVSAPSLLFYCISCFFQRERRVICLRCSWYQDFPESFSFFRHAA